MMYIVGQLKMQNVIVQVDSVLTIVRLMPVKHVPQIKTVMMVGVLMYKIKNVEQLQDIVLKLQLHYHAKNVGQMKIVVMAQTVGEQQILSVDQQHQDFAQIPVPLTIVEAVQLMMNVVMEVVQKRKMNIVGRKQVGVPKLQILIHVVIVGLTPIVET